MPNTITRSLRQDISDAVELSGVIFSGALNDVEFLGRLYELEKLSSYDSRFQTAAGDIWQHTVNNDDYGRNWVFGDDRFQLMSCDDDIYLQFLAETVHPLVRPDAARLVGYYNDILRQVGWELAEAPGIAGRPKYKARKVGEVQPDLNDAKRVAEALDASWMNKEILRAERAIETDPDLAIGCAKDLVESCCKTLLAKLGEEVPKGADFPEVVKKTVKALKLTRDDIPDSAKGADIVRTVLSNLSAITKGMNELRNLYGTGHGRGGDHKGLEPRHARLAVMAATTFVVFVSDTFKKQAG